MMSTITHSKHKFFIFLLISFIFLQSCNLFSSKSDNKKVTEHKIEYASYKEISAIKDVPGIFDFLNRFISWKNWQYWVGLVGIAIIFFIYIIFRGYLVDIFSGNLKKKIQAKEGKYFIIGWSYGFILAVFFTFWYEPLHAFFSQEGIWQIPKGQHFSWWVHWICLGIIVLSIAFAIIREIIIFRFVALYTLFCALLDIVTGIVVFFYFTTVLTYLVAGVGIVLGIIFGAIAAIWLIAKFIALEPSGSGSAYTQTKSKVGSHYDEERRRKQREYEQQMFKENAMRVKEKYE